MVGQAFNFSKYLTASQIVLSLMSKLFESVHFESLSCLCSCLPSLLNPNFLSLKVKVLLSSLVELCSNLNLVSICQANALTAVVS